jgi:hypothetical protein
MNKITLLMIRSIAHPMEEINQIRNNNPEFFLDLTFGTRNMLKRRLLIVFHLVILAKGLL